MTGTDIKYGVSSSEAAAFEMDRLGLEVLNMPKFRGEGQVRDRLRTFRKGYGVPEGLRHDEAGECRIRGGKSVVKTPCFRMSLSRCASMKQRGNLQLYVKSSSNIRAVIRPAKVRRPNLVAPCDGWYHNGLTNWLIKRCTYLKMPCRLPTGSHRGFQLASGVGQWLCWR